MDLSRASVGSNTLAIIPDDVTLPPGVVLKNIEPSEVVVVLDTPVRKDIPVQVDWSGKLPDDLILKDVVTFPSAVTAIGGKQIMDGLSTIYTEKVLLDGIKESGTKTAKLRLQPASVKLATGSRDTVIIKYFVDKRAPR